MVHGDHFDLVVTQARWLALLGDKAYDFAIVVNRVFNNLRRFFGLGYWSLSQWAKLKVKNAVSYIGEYEKALVADARKHEVDGIVCGHIHHAAIHDDLERADVLEQRQRAHGLMVVPRAGAVPESPSGTPGRRYQGT